MDYQNMGNEELEKYVANRDGAAICEMAVRCLTGSKGVEQNYTRAYQLYHKGEKMGLKDAYLGLARMYEQGVGLVKNPQLADMYYKKAGENVTLDSKSIPPEQEKEPVGEKVTPAPIPIQPENEESRTGQSTGTEIVTVTRLAEELNHVEEIKKAKQYSEAKQLLQQFFSLLSEIQSGQKSADAGVDAQMWQINAYWLLGHISYLEEDYQKAEQNFRQPGVLDMYPWAAYLIATIHKIVGYSASEMESDMVLLQDARKNVQITGTELGDVLGMIADLYLENIGVGSGNPIQLAYDCYDQAMHCGNYYAELQMEKFRVMPSGEIEYIE